MFLISGINESLILLFLHISIATISSFSLFLYRKRSFSLFKIVHLFIIFFLCISPYFQFRQNISFWGAKVFTTNEYIYTSFVVLCTISLFNIAYILIDKDSNCKFITKFAVNLSNPILHSRTINLKEFILLFSINIIILFSILYVNKFNLFYVFFRGGVSEENSLLLDIETNKIPQFASLIINNFFKPMTVVIFLTAYKLKANKIELMILGILMLLSAFPTSMPRFSAAAMYIPILLTFSKTLRKPNIFIILFIIGIMLIFPFLNNFRYLTTNSEIEFGLDFEMFVEPHFDSYSSFVHILSNDISTFGNQLLGCFLFWVPRSIWPTKPIGSGAFLSEEINLNWTNISCCYFAEGYINFGFLGILIFTIFISWFCASFDKTYWDINMPNNKNNCFFELIYFLLLGLTFFIMRGDLMSSFAFTLGFIFSVLFIYYLLVFIRKYTFSFKS